MRTSLPLLVIILFVSGCTSQGSEQTQPGVDYQGKEMSEDDIRGFMEAEMKNF